ncbi:uncharacterized protein LOC111797679 isoform X2 [Cucurbita pepo subsp. pepo]|uniref:uncharacterized protein LOC111785738 isoform X2 n=1 Tax=Cucurbita pepo subsp. pepo TaxID=3664 RepID=UPI000C9D93B8|nr:uncharacterized protein LOC111785738 isoform X2 [Cucurbita pepo subsp. pepo]XP_023536533.1 uncharacterized protein LOC111797679 isoform X2 [Cucurbita pepo subsp. pepo]
MIREVSLVSKEMISLKNILLITGASVIQSGAVLEHMIGEALQSHQLKWSVKHFQGSRNNFIGKCCSLQESTPSKCLATKVAILFSLILLDRLQVFFIRSPSTELLSHFNIRFVLLKESATNHSYFKVLFIVATKIYGKALCFFSSGARVKDLEVICKSHPPSASVTPVTQKKKVLNHGFVFITLSHLNPIPFQLSFSLSLSPTSKKLKILYNQPTTIFLVKRGSIFKATKGEREA